MMKPVFMMQVPNADVTKEDEQSKDRKPLLTKSAVLRLLAELSRSYAGCAVLICQHSYHAGQSELITEVGVVFCCSAEFIFVTLIEHNSNYLDTLRSSERRPVVEINARVYESENVAFGYLIS